MYAKRKNNPYAIIPLPGSDDFVVNYKDSVILLQPSDASVKSAQNKIRDIIRQHLGKSPKIMIPALNSFIRGLNPFGILIQMPLSES